MSMRDDFLAWFDTATVNTPASESVIKYVDAIRSASDKPKPKFTENGKILLLWFKSKGLGSVYTSKEIAEEIGMSPKTVPGALRKLILDGYVMKSGADPITYEVTEQGMNEEIN